jgi:hypothetical protein
MKLNDPFGRMASRHQLGYESMRDTMRKSGIDTPSAAWEVVERSKQRAQKYIATGVAVLLLVTLLFPKAMPVTLSFGIFMAMWIVKSTINGKRYIQRYIDEVLEVSEKGDK